MKAATKAEVVDLAAVGAAIRRVRLAKRLTLEQVSATSGVDTGNLSRIERGDMGWSLTTLTGIARGVGVPVAELFAEAERGMSVGMTMELAVSVPVVKIDDLREGNLQSVMKKSAERTRTTVNVGKHAFAFRQKDSSMLPDIGPGELVVVDPDVTPAVGHHVLVNTDEGTVFRLLEQSGGVSYLHAKDRRYPVIQLRPRKHQIIGVAVQAIRSLV